MNLFIICALLTSSVFAMSAKDLEKSLHGTWHLKEVTCAGVTQTLSLKYKMTFNKNKGNYISENIEKKCTQWEQESYTYLADSKIAIKQGTRICKPNPCDADLPATECGKETNPKLPVFDVGFSKNKNEMTLTTQDPNSIDCTGPGQSKPAFFKFVR